MPPHTSDRVFLRRLADKVARAGRAHAKKNILSPRTGFKSRTLARALTIKKGENATMVVRKLYIPHYWARMVHDGRPKLDAATMTKGGLFIWYKNPKEDPRDAGGYPVRAGRRALTKAEFKRDRKAGKIIVAREVDMVEGNPFFENTPGNMRGLGLYASKVIRTEWSAHVYKRLGKLRDARGTVVLRL